MSKKLIEVDAQAFDDLMYWLDRCAEKGHLENCGDLVDPWAIFDANGWKVVEEAKKEGESENCEMCNGCGAIPLFDRDQDGNFMEDRCRQCDGSGVATGVWNEWVSDRCPLAPQKPVFVKYRNGEIDSGVAINFNWYHEGTGKPYPYDIVAYKPARV